MHCLKYCVFAVAIVLVPAGSSIAQAPNQISLRVELDPSLYRRYSIKDAAAADPLEDELAKALVDKLTKDYWFTFCWHLVPALQSSPRGSREVLVRLRKTDNGREKNWEIEPLLTSSDGSIIVRLGAPEGVFDPGVYPDLTTGPPRSKLASSFCDWFIDRYVRKDEAKQMHESIRTHVPAGKGIAAPSSIPSLPANSGIVLWDAKAAEKYAFFNKLRYRFVMGNAVEIQSVGTGLTIPFTTAGGALLHSPVVALINPPSTVPTGEGDVFLEQHPFSDRQFAHLDDGQPITE
jgi:hypothetical protein